MNSDNKDPRQQRRQAGNTGQEQQSAPPRPKGLFKPRRPFESMEGQVDKRLFAAHQLEEAEKTIVAGTGRPIRKEGLPAAKPTNVQMQKPDIPRKRPDPRKVTSRAKARRPVRLKKIVARQPSDREVVRRQPIQSEPVLEEIPQTGFSNMQEAMPDSSVEAPYAPQREMQAEPRQEVERRKDQVPRRQAERPARPPRREFPEREEMEPEYREIPQEAPRRVVRQQQPVESEDAPKTPSRQVRRKVVRKVRPKRVVKEGEQDFQDPQQARRRQPVQQQASQQVEYEQMDYEQQDGQQEQSKPRRRKVVRRVVRPRQQVEEKEIHRGEAYEAPRPPEEQRRRPRREREPEPEYNEIPQQLIEEEPDEGVAAMQFVDINDIEPPQEERQEEEYYEPPREKPQEAQQRKAKKVTFREASRQEPAPPPSRQKAPQAQRQRQYKPPSARKAQMSMKRPPRIDPAEEALRKKAVPYEWGKTDRFSQDQKKFLERVFKQFAENITTKLAPLLQARVNIEYQGARLRPYSVFLQSLYEPISLVLLRMDPETKGLMVVDFPLSFALIDRCLGGIGQPLEEIRYFTDIEVAILERVVSRLIESYQESWGEIKECKPQYLNMEFNPQTVHIVKPSEAMVCISFDVRVAQASGPIYVVMPFEYLKTVLPKSNFEEFMLTRTSPPQAGPSVAPLFAKNLDAATVPVTVELGSTDLMFGELSVLEEGDFIKLDQEITEPLKVKVNERTKFLGRPGLRERKVSVQITRVLQEGDEEFDE